MREATFPKPASEVVATLVGIFRHQRRTEVVELLESAHGYFDEIEYDNWNGGTYTWALRLEVPVPVWAAVEPHLDSIEKDILGKLAYINRQYLNDTIRVVTATPMASGATPLGQRVAPSDTEVRRLWQAGRFRLFLSHVSKHKVVLSNLKKALALRGVDAFVAHDDIEPSFEWQNEIELALRSMHALAAIITPDFHASLWTDQEVGWALGRGVLVVPVRLGADPYGLVGRFQGVSGSITQPETLAELIVIALLKNPLTHGEMRRSLISSFAEAFCCEMAEAACRLIVSVSDITDEERDALWRACTENPDVIGAIGVTTSIFATFGERPKPEISQTPDDIPF